MLLLTKKNIFNFRQKELTSSFKL